MHSKSWQEWQKYLHQIHEWYKSNLWDIMRSKWSLRGFEPQFFHFWRKNMILMKKKQWKKQDLNPRSSSLKLSAKPTELSSLVTDYSNILSYWLIHHQTKHMKSNKYTIYHEICIYSKSPHPVFCLNLKLFYHFPPSRMVESPQG